MNKVETDDLYPYSIQPTSDVGKWRLFNYEKPGVVDEGSYKELETLAKALKAQFAWRKVKHTNTPLKGVTY